MFNLSAFHDLDLGQMYYDESVTQEHGYNIFQADDYSLLSLDNYDIKSVLKKDLLKYVVESHYSLSSARASSLHLMCKPLSKLTKLELIELAHVALYEPSEIIDWMIDNLKPLFTVYKAKGSCQGDIMTIIIPQDQPTDRSYLDYIDNIRFNAPLYIKLEIDGNEYHLDELTSGYDYDKDELIQSVKNTKWFSGLSDGVQVDLLEYLCDNLPEFLDYV